MLRVCMCVYCLLCVIHCVKYCVYRDELYRIFSPKDLYCRSFAGDSKVAKLCDKNHKSPSLGVL